MFIVYATFWQKFSAILTFVALAWCICVGLFVVIKLIVNKIKDKIEMKKDAKKEQEKKKSKE